MDTVIDFGNISYGVTYTRSFPIKNYTSLPMRISGLGQSCTCVNVSIPNEYMVVAPGSTSYINVSFTPGSTGLVQRSFWFKINEVDSYTITVKGYVS